MNNESTKGPVVTLEHLTAFGGIIHSYALAETGLKIALACLLDTDLVDLMIMTEPYNSASLGYVIRSIASARDPITPASTELIALADGLRDASALRNSIAHDRWNAGLRAGSIRPTKLDIRTGKARVRGLSETDVDYMVSDLHRANDNLVNLNRSIGAYLDRHDCHPRVTGRRDYSKAAD